MALPAVSASVQVVACVSDDSGEQLCPLRLALLPSSGSIGQPEREALESPLEFGEAQAQCTQVNVSACSVRMRSPPIGAPLYLLLNVTHPLLVLNVTLRLELDGALSPFSACACACASARSTAPTHIVLEAALEQHFLTSMRIRGCKIYIVHTVLSVLMLLAQNVLPTPLTASRSFIFLC